MNTLIDQYTYRVTWSQEDQEFVGSCLELPSLSWLEKTAEKALSGIRKLAAECLQDMQHNEEPIPEPHNPMLISPCINLAQANPNIEVLWLYGSQAKGNANEQSDYDFAVAFKNIKADALEQRLEPILLAQEWADALGVSDQKISIVDINHIPIPLAYEIFSTGKVLHHKNGLRLAREENRISGMWADYLIEKRRYE